LNPSSPAPTAAPRSRRPCPPTLANFSTCAPGAVCGLSPSRETAACSALTGRFRARQFRRSSRARPARLRAARGDPDGKRYGARLERLAAQPAYQPIGLVDSPGRHSRWPVCPGTSSGGNLDHCARLDGYGMHAKCQTLRTYPLPLHRTLLSRRDRPGARTCVGYRFRRLIPMAGDGFCHSCGKPGHLVGHGAGVGKILDILHRSKRHNPSNRAVDR
jgi:hypothetical protein